MKKKLIKKKISIPLEIQKQLDINSGIKVEPSSSFTPYTAKRQLKSLTGVTLIEVLIGTFLFSIVFLGIFAAYQLGIKVIGLSKNKITATAIANEEVEKIRNLPYKSIGIIGGTLPTAEGVLASSEVIALNNQDYLVERRIEYISDEAGQDLDCPLNYKRAEIKVSWSGKFSGEIKMVTDIAPKDKVEEIASCQAQPGGILSVKVFDAYGLMVFSPLIEVFNAENGQFVVSYTPINGKKDIPLSVSAYKIVVSKSGYSKNETYGTNEIANPIKSHPIVLEGKITEISFSIDKISAFSINTLFPVEEGEDPVFVPNVEFILRGEKLIGYDAEDNPVYKYSQNHISNSQGQIYIDNLEWDNYFFSVVSETGLHLVNIEPEPDPGSGAIGLAPDTFLVVNLYLESENSLLIIVKDDETSEPVFSATVRLYDTDLEYDNILYTDEKGRVFFIPLEAETYNLEIEAPGYSSYQGQVLVFVHTKKTVEIERIE